MFALRSQGFLTGFAALSLSGTLDVLGIVTATGFVGPVTGNTTGTHTGAVAGDVTGTGTSTIPTVGVTTALNLAGIMTAAETRPTAFAADQTDFAGSGLTWISTWTSDVTPRTVNSRSIASGQVQIVRNGNTVTAIILANNAAGTNKFLCPGGVNYSLGPGQAVLMFYSPTDAKIQVIPFT